MKYIAYFHFWYNGAAKGFCLIRAVVLASLKMYFPMSTVAQATRQSIAMLTATTLPEERQGHSITWPPLLYFPPSWGVPSTAASVTWFGVTLQMKRQGVDWDWAYGEFAGMYSMYIGCIVGNRLNRRRPCSADLAGNVSLAWSQALTVGSLPLETLPKKTSSIHFNYYLYSLSFYLSPLIITSLHNRTNL